MTASARPDPKRMYERPKLLVFGDVRELTMNVGMVGLADGGKGNDKSQK